MPKLQIWNKLVLLVCIPYPHTALLQLIRTLILKRILLQLSLVIMLLLFLVRNAFWLNNFWKSWMYFITKYRLQQGDKVSCLSVYQFEYAVFYVICPMIRQTPAKVILWRFRRHQHQPHQKIALSVVVETAAGVEGMSLIKKCNILENVDTL